MEAEGRVTYSTTTFIVCCLKEDVLYWRERSGFDVDIYTCKLNMHFLIKLF
jgi:hypothetical protein